MMVYPSACQPATRDAGRYGRPVGVHVKARRCRPDIVFDHCFGGRVDDAGFGLRCWRREATSAESRGRRRHVGELVCASSGVVNPRKQGLPRLLFTTSADPHASH